jgi:DNA polymerase-1
MNENPASSAPRDDDRTKTAGPANGNANGDGNALPERALYLVDGSGFIFRAFHALPPLNRPDGTPVNAVLGFTNMLMRLLADVQAHQVAVIFDAGRETFRNQIYDLYKANRDEPPAELVPQFALIREATAAFSLPCLEMPGFEADDLIATYARAARERGQRVVIVSSDKDLMQLVRDGVTMWDPIKQRPIGPAEVVEKFGVAPEKVVDVQALAGDSVDNVPGVPGIGIKTAAQLITEFGSLEALLENAATIKQPKRRETLIENAENARLSKRLVQLDEHADLPIPLDQLPDLAPDYDTLIRFMQAQGFRSAVARVEQVRAKGGAPRATNHGESNGAAKAAHYESPIVKNAGAVAIDRGAYHCVTEEPALLDWIARARAAGVVAVDTETDALNSISGGLVGISLGLADGAACYIPLAHQGEGAGMLAAAHEAPQQMAFARALMLLKPLLEDPSVLKIGHNIKYDLQVFLQHDIVVSPIEDTMLMSYVLEGGRHGHGMDELSALILGHKTIAFDDVCGKGKTKISFDRVALDKATAYAAEDADVTYRLWQNLKPRLLAERQVALYETIERRLVPVVARMEYAGIKIDVGALKTMSGDFGLRIAALEEEVHALAGRPFNIGSPKQLGEVLFGEMGLPGGEKSKTGAWGTAADILEPLAAQGHDIVRKVLDWRQLTKLKSTYVDALQQQVDVKTGRVHTSYALAATNTGRLSSTDPNLQNIPIRTEEGKKIRSAFIAEKGCVLLSIDYSQIELRLVAEMAGIEGLRRAFAQGLDIHAATASEVFAIPLEEMTGEIRRRAKAINFGIIYGISAFGLANQLGIPQAEANEYIKAYNARYPELRVYMNGIIEGAKKHGFVETQFGRKIFTPGISDKNPATRAFAQRQAINGPLQGTAADIIKKAMVKVAALIARKALPARLLLQVHDELVFEVDEKAAIEVAPEIQRAMEGIVDFVMLKTEAGIGRSWAEAH